MPSVPSKVGPRDRPEALLAGLLNQDYCVPDLQLDDFPLRSNCLGPELDADGRVVLLFKFVVSELQHQARFAHVFLSSSVYSTRRL